MKSEETGKLWLHLWLRIRSLQTQPLSNFLSSFPHTALALVLCVSVFEGNWASGSGHCTGPDTAVIWFLNSSASANLLLAYQAPTWAPRLLRGEGGAEKEEHQHQDPTLAQTTLQKQRIPLCIRLPQTPSWETTAPGSPPLSTHHPSEPPPTRWCISKAPPEKLSGSFQALTTNALWHYFSCCQRV